MRKVLSSLFLFVFLLTSGNAQLLQRSIALLDLGDRNSESNDSRVFSAKHMLEVVGIPFEVVKSPEEAMEHAIIITSSQIISNSFSEQEIAALSTYVFTGGVLIAPRVLEEDWFDLFGIASINLGVNGSFWEKVMVE